MQIPIVVNSNIIIDLLLANINGKRNRKSPNRKPGIIKFERNSHTRNPAMMKIPTIHNAAFNMTGTLVLSATVFFKITSTNRVENSQHPKFYQIKEEYEGKTYCPLLRLVVYDVAILFSKTMVGNKQCLLSKTSNGCQLSM